MNDTRGPDPDDADTREALRQEFEQLGRIVDEQERTLAALRREVALHAAAIGWRLQLRLDPLRAWMLRVPVLRQLYRTWYRALEIWVDEGFLKIFYRTRSKIDLALSGRNFFVEDRDRVPLNVEEQYQRWLARHGTPPGSHQMKAAVARLRHTPLVSVLAVLEAADTSRLAHVLGTLRAQGYERWELCLAMPAGVRTALRGDLESLIASEPRLRVADAGDGSANYGDAYRVSRGDLVSVMNADDELAPDALVELVTRLDEEPSADVVYSDEDVISNDGRRDDPIFKPDWSPDLLLSMNYLERFGLVRKRIVDEAGGFAPGAGLGQTYDLMLRVSEKTDRIAHVPKVLYHARRHQTTLDTVLARHAANRDERRAIASALARRGRPGRTEAVFARRGVRCYAARFDLVERPLVSIVIPTRDKRALLQTTIESIRARTDYDRYEIIVVDNDSAEPDAVDYLSSLSAPCQVHRWREPFNYSAINNFGFRHARGEQVLFLNNDVEVIRPDWLTALLEHAQRPEVGAVGAKLLYADGRIQHAGVVVGINRAAANAFRSWPGETIGAPRLADLTRNCSAVTGACMMVPRRVLEKVGGFDETLRVVLNDVDLCLRIRAQGYLVVYTPHALLYHHEGSTRGQLHPPPDQQAFGRKWKDFLDRGDPYYNPNLTDRRDDWSIRVEEDDGETHEPRN
jgi:GT2 family glycosyltransferase